MGEYKKLLFIINPVSGRKKGIPYVTDIIRLFYEEGYLSTTMLTTARGDAVTFASEYGSEYDLIVCLGGDGTLNEVVTGLAKSGIHTPVGYIPAGSTNDFAECHNLSTQVMEAARNIMEKDYTPCDVGRIGQEGYFTYVAAFGSIASLSYSVSQNLKNILGHTAYLLPAPAKVLAMQTTYMKVTDGDGNVYEGDYIYGSATNSTSLAGMFEIPKDIVDTKDGKFEVFLIRKPRSIKQFFDLVMAMFGQDYGRSDCVDFFQADHLHFDSGEEESDWTLDGEHYHAPLTFDIENISQFISIKG